MFLLHSSADTPTEIMSWAMCWAQRSSAAVLAGQVEKGCPRAEKPDSSRFFAHDHIGRLYQSWEWNAGLWISFHSIAFVLCSALLILQTLSQASFWFWLRKGLLNFCSCSGVLYYKLFCCHEPKLLAFVSVRTGWKMCGWVVRWHSPDKLGIKGTFLDWLFLVNSELLYSVSLGRPMSLIFHLLHGRN